MGWQWVPAPQIRHEELNMDWQLFAKEKHFQVFLLFVLFFFCTLSKLACSECSSKVTAFETTLNWQHRVAGGCLEMGLC